MITERPRTRSRATLGLLAAVLLLASCGDDAGDTATEPTSSSSTSTTTTVAEACAAAITEPLDSTSFQHVIGDAELTYQSDPPTSGPHKAGPVVGGVLDEPLPRPRQVGQLEAGGILLQHRDLSADELAALSTLAAEDVAVVPNADLPSRVVATSWLHKQVCDGVDVAALQQFVTDHRGQGPGH
jgi:hypothetical protein